MFYLIAGLSLGLASAVSPGPLLALVISETLKGNWRNGFAVSVTPLITDSIIITSVLLLVSRLDDLYLAFLSFAGAAFLFYVAYESATTKDFGPAKESSSIKKGVATNLLNPHPYLFWLTVGGPLLIKSWSNGISYTLVFLLSFYSSFIGLKFLISLSVDKMHEFKESAYLIALKLSIVLLLIAGVYLIYEGIILAIS